MIKYKMNWNTSHLHSQVNGSFSHQEAKKCGGVGEVEVLRTLALGIDVKWGCPSNTTSCVHGHTYWICVNFLLRGLSWECLLLESEVWGQIRFLKGTGNGGWSMKTKFYPKSMDPHWMRVYVGVHSLYFDTKLQALSMEWMQKNLCYQSVCSCTNHISEVVIGKKSFVALSLPENDCIGHTIIHKKTKFYVFKINECFV